MPMFEIFNRNRQRVAIAENAFNVTEDRKINSLWYFSFSLPYGDPKNDYCSPFCFVRYNDGEFYRIMPSTETITETGAIEYQCEHVLATLLDNVLFGHYTVGNIGTYTADCINYVLSKQTTRNWVLHECDFRRQFEYGWEQENLLSALFSIATPLENYIWKTDTSVYPWRLSLKQIDTTGKPQLYIRRGYNMLSYQRESDTQQICTRLYPLGYGEGVNQLTIRDINNGVPYLQSPQAYIDRYGLIERIWTDRRYEDAESLKAAAQVMLNELQEPAVSLDIKYREIGDTNIGDRVRIVHPDISGWTDTYITEQSLNYGDITESTIKIANKSTSIASTVSDLANRQRIEESYAQGATQIYSQSLQANCDTKNGAEIDFFIPSEMRIVNKVIAKIKMSSFLAYSKSTSTSPAVLSTTASQAQMVQTSAAGGGGQYVSEAGGQNTAIGSSIAEPENAKIYIKAHTHTLGNLTHQHEYSIPSHSHGLTIPAHAHEITPGMYRFGNAKNFTIFVNGKQKGSFSGTSTEVDITNFLLSGNEAKIPRGSWLSMEVRPDDLAYISIDLIFQGFVQSRGDMTV